MFSFNNTKKTNKQPNIFSQNNNIQLSNNDIFGSNTTQNSMVNGNNSSQRKWLFNNNSQNSSKYQLFYNSHEYSHPFAHYLPQKPLIFKPENSKQQSPNLLSTNKTGKTSNPFSRPLSNLNNPHSQFPYSYNPPAQNFWSSKFSSNAYKNEKAKTQNKLFCCSCQSIYEWQERAASLEQENIELKAKIRKLQKHNEDLKQQNYQFMISNSYKSSRPEHYVVEKHSNFTLRYLPLKKTCLVSELTFKNNKILLEFLSPMPFIGKLLENCVIIMEDQCHIIDETWSKAPMRLTIFNIWDYKSQTRIGKQEIVHKIVLEASKEHNFDFDRDTGNLTIERNL